MQGKLTLVLLLVGLLSASTVGGVAYWTLMRGFTQEIQDKAFQHHQEDMKAYLSKYGSWDAAIKQESFHRFVTSERRRVPPPVPSGAAAIDRRGEPPFRFLTLNPQGVVLRGVADYREGDKVPASVLREARPIEHEGNVAVLAAPIGEPMLTPQDKSYLAAMRQALLTGFTVAVLVAVFIGVVAGRRMSSTLQTLTQAIHAMQSDRESELQVEVRSKDELGKLASAFNRMNRELSQAHRELRELSIRDPLTNLFNRRYFIEQANGLFQHAVRYRHPLSIMLADVDHFKQVNDHFSHALGDDVLRVVASILRESTRKSDLVARYGGEEFVILFPESELAQAARVCEELRRRIEAHPWHELQPQLRVTISIGLSDDLKAGSVERMLAHADERLYAAKHGGRNRVIPAPGVAA